MDKREKHLAGLCCECGQPKNVKTWRCSMCIKIYNERKKYLRRNLLINGLCQHCGQRPVKPKRKQCVECLTIAATRARQYNYKDRLEVLSHYGNGKCVCCDEANPLFLSLDHVNNNGAEHRRSLPSSLRRGFYQYLRSRGFPNDPPLQVMCFNCNRGKFLNGGVCPHQSGNFLDMKTVLKIEC